MKWYKKQMNELLKNNKEKDSTAPNSKQGKLIGKVPVKNIRPVTPTFVSPVKQRNVNRPKTDSK